MSDSSWHRLRPARMAGLRVHHGQILSELAETSLEFNDINRLLAVIPNDAYNALACTRFAPELGGANVFQLAGKSHEEHDSMELAPTVSGRVAFGEDVHYEDLMRAHYRDWRFHKTRLIDEYTYEQFLEEHPKDGLLIAVAQGSGEVNFCPWRKPNNRNPAIR
jgi:hypothetical protein